MSEVKLIQNMKMLFAMILLTGLAVEAALAQFESPTARTGKLQTSGYVNVHEAPYSAAGDGKKDATRAIQAALDAVGAGGGGIVFVPTGTYLIATHLKVPGGTALVGTARAPQLYTPKYPGTTLLAVEGAGNPDGTPFITLLGPNSTLEGINVLYSEQRVSETPVPYPWTVRGGGGGDNVSIINVILSNPYQGVDLATGKTSRHFVRGLYGQPLLKGLWVDQCTDIGRIQDVHFWPFWSLDKRVTDFTTAKATAFIFQRTDWEVVQDIFCWGYRVGIEFSSSESGGMNGQMTNVDLDGVDIGIAASYTKPEGIAISNLAIANDGRGKDRVAIWGRSGAKSAHLVVRGGSFWGHLDRVVRWENPGTLSLADSRVLPFDPNGPILEILAGRAMIHDNFIGRYRTVKSESSLTAIRIGPATTGVIIHGNQLNGNAVVSEGASHTITADNLP